MNSESLEWIYTLDLWSGFGKKGSYIILWSIFYSLTILEKVKSKKEVRWMEESKSYLTFVIVMVLFHIYDKM
jgi:hypothetical protein